LLEFLFKCLKSSDEIEFQTLLRDYNLEGLDDVELEYDDLPVIVTCLVKSKRTEYYNRRIKLDIPKETYFGKLFLDDTANDKLEKYLLSKYGLDFAGLVLVLLMMEIG
jgi:hypothetical protein